MMFVSCHLALATQHTQILVENGTMRTIQLVRLTEVCGKVPSEKNAYKSVKTAVLLFNVIDVDHQNSCLITK